ATRVDESPFQGIGAGWASLGRFSGSSRGHYRLGRLVATGGMGEVYEATDSANDRRVAVKVLSEEGVRATERLRREAQHASELNHPNVCKVYEIVEDAEGPYIVMEFLEGTSLRDAVPEGGLDSSKASPLAVQLARAIDHAHHR